MIVCAVVRVRGVETSGAVALSGGWLYVQYDREAGPRSPPPS